MSGMASPKISHISWKDRQMTRPSTVSVDTHNALSGEEAAFCMLGVCVTDHLNCAARDPVTDGIVVGSFTSKRATSILPSCGERVTGV